MFEVCTSFLPKVLKTPNECKVTSLTEILHTLKVLKHMSRMINVYLKTSISEVLLREV